MSREDYIKYRNANSPEPMYEYYKENHKGDKPLTMGDFFQAMQMWPNAVQAFNYVLREYDVKFEVMVVSDLKTGRMIKYT